MLDKKLKSWFTYSILWIWHDEIVLIINIWLANESSSILGKDGQCTDVCKTPVIAVVKQTVQSGK